MRLPLTINGTDFSELASRCEYTVGYNVRTGSNGGMMLNGEMTVDILAYKAVITWPLNDMTAADLAAIQTAVLTDYVTVTYWDTKTNASRQAVFMPKISSAKIGILRTSGKWWKDITLTLEEK